MEYYAVKQDGKVVDLASTVDGEEAPKSTASEIYEKVSEEVFFELIQSPHVLEKIIRRDILLEDF